MTTRARLYAQLAIVCDCDAAALLHEYEMDPTGQPVVPTEAELDEAVHLSTVGDSLFARAKELGFSGGTDAAFAD